MWQRLAENRLRRLARRYPVVCILGARQVGKTTLARRTFPAATYLDLERPADLDRLEADAEFALERMRPPVVIDEAQAWPPVFAVVRSLVDRHRWRKERFVLVGSAQPVLVRGAAESLAGRVAFVDLDPLTALEASRGTPRVTVERLWLRGGYPRALAARSGADWREWMEAYTRTFIERDVGALGLDVSAPTMRRLLTMLAQVHGGLWNASELGSSLGTSYHTVNRYADILEHSFLLRKLAPYFRNIGKRLTRSPKVFLRDSGVLHRLIGIDSEALLEVSPRCGASFEGFVIEQIVRRERLVHPESEFFFWRTASGDEVDLLIDRRREIIAVEIKRSRRVGTEDLRGLRACMRDLRLRRGFVLCGAERAYEASPGIEVLPVETLLRARSWRL